MRVSTLLLGSVVVCFRKAKEAEMHMENATSNGAVF